MRQIRTQHTQNNKGTISTMAPHAKLDDFSNLESPHPYGVLPGGNLFFGSNSSPPRSEAIFSDDLWQQILGFCDAPSLVRVVQSSHYLYVAGHEPELWRDLVLRRCHAEKAVISKVGPSWKDTFVVLFAKNNPSPAHHRPIEVGGVYSDHYYRLHLCRSFAIPSAWLDPSPLGHSNKHEVPRVSVDKMTPAAFLENYERPNMPVIIEGAGKSRALDMWRDPNYFLQQTTETNSFRTTSGGAPLPADFTLSAYQNYCKFPYLEESPLYLFDRTAFSSTKQWSADFFPEFHQACQYWNPAGSHGHDLLQYLGVAERPDHTWLITGPKRSGSIFHIDPNATHAWNACIAGRKRWICYPPGVTPPGVFPSADGDEVALVSGTLWINSR
jgi:hypothetical protein